MLPKPDCVFSVPSLYDGLKLDGRLYFPRRPREAQGLYVNGFFIMAHPYATLGGCWDDPVVHLVGSVMLRLGFVVATFNFRGAVGSAGRTSWTGHAELADYVSFYALALRLINEHEVREHMLTHGDSASSGQPLLVLGGYSYGSMIASYLPEINRVGEVLSGAVKESPAHEISDRAIELSKALLGFLESQDSRARRSLAPSDVSSIPPSPRGVMMGGNEAESSNRRLSRESLSKSFDADGVRRSFDRMKHRFSLPKKGENRVEASDDPFDSSISPLTVLPAVAFLLISPLLPPVSSFITFFSKPSFKDGDSDQKHHPDDQRQSNLSENQSMLVFGDQDIFTSAPKLRKWIQEMQSKPKCRLTSKEVAGAGHFWKETGTEQQLQATVTGWVMDVLKGYP